MGVISRKRKEMERERDVVEEGRKEGKRKGRTNAFSPLTRGPVLLLAAIVDQVRSRAEERTLNGKRLKESFSLSLVPTTRLYSTLLKDS